MVKPPVPAPGIPDPIKPLIDMQDALLASAQAITDFIQAQPNALSNRWDGVRNIRDALADNALKLATVIMNNIEPSLRHEISNLKIQINKATQALKTIGQVTLVIKLASAILAAAIGVASGGGIIAGIPAIITLASTVAEAVAETEKQQAGGKG